MTLKTDRVKEFKESIACKLWDTCKSKACFIEATKYGSCVWSKEVCYGLKDLEESGLIERR